MPPVQNQTPINKKLPQWAIYITEVLGILLCILVASASFFYWFDKNKVEQDALTSDITPISTSTQTLQTASWKTYRNEEYGFEFKYPTYSTDVKIDESGKKIDLLYLDKADNKYYQTFGFVVLENKGNKSIQEWFKDNVDFNGILVNAENFKLVDIGGNGKMYILDKLPISSKYDDGPVAGAYIMSKDSSYVFVPVLHEDRQVSFQDNISKILSTFKFVSTSTSVLNTSDWKTYKDSLGRFEFKYPKDLKLDLSSFPNIALWNSHGRIDLEVKNGVLDPNNIDGMYGKVGDAKKETINSKDWYRYEWGDGGCGGPVFVTDFNKNILNFHVMSCMDESNKPLLYDEVNIINQILSSFKFVSTSTVN